MQRPQMCILCQLDDRRIARLVDQQMAGGKRNAWEKSGPTTYFISNSTHTTLGLNSGLRYRLHAWQAISNYTAFVLILSRSVSKTCRLKASWPAPMKNVYTAWIDTIDVSTCKHRDSFGLKTAYSGYLLIWILRTQICAWIVALSPECIIQRTKHVTPYLSAISWPIVFAELFVILGNKE